MCLEMSTIAGVAHVVSVLTVGNADPGIHAYMQKAMLELFGVMLVILCLERAVERLSAALVLLFESYRKRELATHKVMKCEFANGMKVVLLPSHIFTAEDTPALATIASATADADNTPHEAITASSPQVARLLRA